MQEPEARETAVTCEDVEGNSVCPRHAGRDLFEQLQPFRANAVFEAG